MAPYIFIFLFFLFVAYMLIAICVSMENYRRPFAENFFWPVMLYYELKNALKNIVARGRKEK